MKIKFLFTYFLYFSPMLALGGKIGDYPLTEDSILNKNTLKNQLSSALSDFTTDEFFYTYRAGSARPTCVGTFLTYKNSLHLSTGGYSGNELSFSFWFYPGGDDNDGYVWTITDDPSKDPLFYIGLNEDILGLGSFDSSIQVNDYKWNEWHLLIITLVNDKDAKMLHFNAYDTSDLSKAIASVDSAFTGSDLSHMQVTLGNYRKESSGFSGFVSRFSVYNEILNNDAITALFSNSCDPANTCDICPIDDSGTNKCIDFKCLYPVGVEEFEPIYLCDNSCDHYCSGNTDTSCIDCLIPEYQRPHDKSCTCPEGTPKIYKRGQLSGCTSCIEGCGDCEETYKFCFNCADPSADKNSGCKCPNGEERQEGSLNFCIPKCEDSNCGSCLYDYKSCDYCKDGYYFNSDDGQNFVCDACNKECKNCEDTADYCSECNEEGKIAFNGDCVCDHLFYSTYSIVGGENVLSCTACSDNCETCIKDCFMCTDISDSDKDEKCFVFSLGYQIRFRGEIIHMKFSEELEKDLEKHDFSFKDKNNKWHDAADWDLVKINDREYKVFSDLTKDDLPIEVAFTFAKKDSAEI